MKAKNGVGWTTRKTTFEGHSKKGELGRDKHLASVAS